MIPNFIQLSDCQPGDNSAVSAAANQMLTGVNVRADRYPQVARDLGSRSAKLLYFRQEGQHLAIIASTRVKSVLMDEEISGLIKPASTGFILLAVNFNCQGREKLPITV